MEPVPIQTGRQGTRQQNRVLFLDRYTKWGRQDWPWHTERGSQGNCVETALKEKLSKDLNGERMINGAEGAREFNKQHSSSSSTFHTKKRTCKCAKKMNRQQKGPSPDEVSCPVKTTQSNNPNSKNLTSQSNFNPNIQNSARSPPRSTNSRVQESELERLATDLRRGDVVFGVWSTVPIISTYAHP
jgi:hypothetical protein